MRATIPDRVRVGVWACAIVLSPLAVRADQLVAEPRVVARVGGETITARDVQRRAAVVGEQRLERWGHDWPERRRRLLSDVLVVEALLSVEGAKDAARPLADDPVDRALCQVLRARLEREIRREGIGDERVAAYYEEHRRHYVQPASILLWRILLSSESSARELIESLKDVDEARFRSAARERSLDHATNMRGGTLGYVRSDGQTSYPQVRVDPALYAAALEVDDGQLVPRAVVEGRYHAVVWRRSSRPERVVPRERAAAEIRELLIEAELRRREDQLLETARRQYVRDHRPGLLDDFRPSLGDTARAPRGAGPATPEAPRVPARIVVAPTDRGLR